jgi:hypothetical protein
MHKVMMGLAISMSVLGGIILSALVLLTCVSIVGRLLNGYLHGDFMQGVMPGFADWALALGIGPVNGDFELVEAGVALAIFAFFPLCQITGGHASVDIVTNMMPKRTQKVLFAVIDIVFALVLILIAWRLFEGMASKKSYGETTFLIQFPIWWAYAASFVGSVLAAIIGVHVAGVRVVEMMSGRTILLGTLELEQ